jgi:hypothetical protein
VGLKRRSSEDVVGKWKTLCKVVWYPKLLRDILSSHMKNLRSDGHEITSSVD